jgi:catechol 2,3-dioxygenase
MVTGSPQAQTTLPASTTLGTVRLTVADLGRARDFYERALGLPSTQAADGSLLLGGDRLKGSIPPLVSLVGDRSAPPRNPRETGLFHFALLVPTRRDLAVAVARLAKAGWRLDGASDHLVSEALYLHDPDGNGIEIYRDRDRSQWRRHDDGRIAMATLPLDLAGLLSELDDAAPDPSVDAWLPEQTRVGHVHLQVAELASSERFYADLLGFEVMVRDYPGALFVAAGGYHHHVGLNTWNSRGGATPAPGSIGLRAFELRLGDEAALSSLLGRLADAGATLEPDQSGGMLVRDPSGNGVLLTV